MADFTVSALYDEITLDPEGIGLDFATMTDAELAEKLNATDTGRKISRGVVYAHEVFAQIDPVELSDKCFTDPKAAENRDYLRLLFGIQEIDATSLQARRVLLDIFGAASTTISTLGDWREVDGSRARELWGRNTNASEVAEARKLLP